MPFPQITWTAVPEGLGSRLADGKQELKLAVAVTFHPPDLTQLPQAEVLASHLRNWPDVVLAKLAAGFAVEFHLRSGTVIPVQAVIVDEQLTRLPNPIALNPFLWETLF